MYEKCSIEEFLDEDAYEAWIESRQEEA